jgi:CPA2 family monovalent cation:H+ antiporter-2
MGGVLDKVDPQAVLSTQGRGSKYLSVSSELWRVQLRIKFTRGRYIRRYPMLGTIVYDLLIILAAGLLASLVCRWLRISVLVGYLLVGALVGKGCFGWVSDERHELEYIAEAGVFLLLFSIGLELSLDELWRLGRNLVIGGSVQMLLVALPVAALLLAVGTGWQTTIVMAAAASFSSTVLVFKALSEWGHASLPHGRRAIGILLFQDAALIPLLLLVPLLTGTGEAAGPVEYLMLVVMSVLLVAAVVVLQHVLARWIITLFVNYRSPELVILFVLVSLGGVTLGAHTVGLPPVIGAFAAGLIFSGNRWTKQIDALVLPFRETFAAVFFVSLGLLYDPRLLWSEPLLTLGCLAGLILVKWLAAGVALWLTRIRWQAAAGMGIGLAHIGEFAFVLVLLGWEAGVISESDYQRIMALAIGSLILTPLLLKTGLRWTRLTKGTDATATATSRLERAGQEALVIGAGPIGRRVASQLETAGKDVCLIDLSPVNLHGFAQEGFRTVAGDATDRSTLELARAEVASLAVVSVPDDEAAICIVRTLRAINANCFVLVRCRYEGNVTKLTKCGANRVVSEEAQACAALLDMLADFH